jgi:NADH-ubiquinone oxidoreductase chain 5
MLILIISLIGFNIIIFYTNPFYNSYIYNTLKLYYIINNNSNYEDIRMKISNFFNQRLFIELFYNSFLSEVILKLGGQTTKILDKGSIEYLGPYGLEVGLLSVSNKLSKLDSGIITSYALYILSGLVIYLYFLNSIFSNELILIVFISLFYVLLRR